MNSKKLAIIGTSILLACASPLVLADGDNSGLANSINNLNNAIGSLNNNLKSLGGIKGTIEAVAHAGEKQLTQAMYEYDKDLPTVMQVNQSQQNLSKEVNQTATQNTGAKEVFQLSALADPIVATQPNAKQTGAPQRNQDRNNAIAQLTVNTPASDTLYSTNPLVVNAQYNNGSGPKFDVAKPTVLHDNYFNFGSVINPVVYTPDQANAAKYYVTYLSKDYTPLTTGVDFSKFVSAMHNSKPDRQYTLLRNLMTNPTFQKYELALRSAVASQTVATNNLNYLMAERTPVKGLGTKAGMSTADASPLQVEKYQATRRVNSKQWYQQMQAATPATVQRETLFVLAELEKQNYQAHLDRERILATLTAQAASSGSGATALQAQAQGVNQVLKDIEKTSQKATKMPAAKPTS